MFVDEVIIKVKAGNGGDGCTAFRREKYIPDGGPFGGNGGRGANIIFKTDETEDALIHYEVKAGAGANETLGFLTSAEGPTGEAIKIPAKAST
jgi:GTP-binding protein